MSPREDRLWTCAYEHMCPHVGTVISTAREAQESVVTTVKRTSTEVRALKHALIKGDTNRPSLPEGVVEKILDMAEYWCCVEKECKTLFFCV